MNSLTVLFVVCFFFSLSARAGSPLQKTPELLQKGKALYATNCVLCHGVKGDGMGDAGKYMRPKLLNFSTEKFKKGDTVSDVFNSITKGLDGTAMNGYPDLSEGDRWALAYYVLSFKVKK